MTGHETDIIANAMSHEIDIATPHENITSHENTEGHENASIIPSLTEIDIASPENVTPPEKKKPVSLLSKIIHTPSNENDYAMLGNVDVGKIDLFRAIAIYNKAMVDNGLPPLSDQEKSVYLFFYRKLGGRLCSIDTGDFPAFVKKAQEPIKSLQERFLLFIGSKGGFATFRPDEIERNYHFTKKVPVTEKQYKSSNIEDY